MFLIFEKKIIHNYKHYFKSLDVYLLLFLLNMSFINTTNLF